MSKFWELFGQSVVTQALITTLIVGTACYLWIIGQPVPSDLYGALYIAIGFFFGSKYQNAAYQAAKSQSIITAAAEATAAANGPCGDK
jgi:hypothetical protein